MLSQNYLDLISDLLPELLDDASKKRLSQLYDRVVETNEKINITSLVSPIDVSLKHFADSLSLFLNPLFKERVIASKGACDIGCGGGFPGLPIACVLPELSLTMIDSTEKKITALRENAELLGLGGICPLWGRGEDLAGKKGVYRSGFDLAVSRAVARLPILLELCLPFLKKDGLFFAMKGAQASEELEESKRAITSLGGVLEDVYEIKFPTLDAAKYMLHPEEAEKLSEFVSASRSLIIVRKKNATPEQYPRTWAQMKKKPL